MLIPMAAQRQNPADVLVVFAGVGLLLAVLDFAWAGSGGARAWLVAASSGVAWGTVVGAAWLVGLVGPSRFSTKRPEWAWVALSCIVVHWLASDIGVFAKLGSRNHKLALAGLAASLAAGVGCLVLLFVFGARRGGPSIARGRWTGWRKAGASALCVAALLAIVVDRNVFAGEHQAAHAALRVGALSALGLAVLWHRTILWRKGLDVVVLASVLVVSSLPFILLRGSLDSWTKPLFTAPLVLQGINTLRGLSDLDGDGFSSSLAGGDCAPWDPDVYPGARDLPDDGIDQDCSGGDAVTREVDPTLVPIPEVSSPRSILLITVETLRADHLSLYGYARETTPELERLGKKSTVFERAHSTGGWTSIALPTMLRGTYARRLVWSPFLETTNGRLLASDQQAQLRKGEHPMQVFMLPQRSNPPPVGWWLHRRGMTTAAVVDDRFSELLDPSVGTSLGFDVFVEGDQVRGDDPDDAVVDLAIRTMEKLPDDRPWFLWVHLFGPHSPSTHHPGTPSFGSGIAAEYDHEIRFVDTHIGRLVDAAQAQEPSLAFIITADHGETIDERDRRHGFSLKQEIIHVPLLIGGEGIPARRVSTPVSTVDVLPTVMALTHTPGPEYLDGHDILGSVIPPRLLFSDTWHRGSDGRPLFDETATFDAEVKLTYSLTHNAWALSDPSDAERTADEISATVDLERYHAAVRDYLESGAVRTQWGAE